MSYPRKRDGMVYFPDHPEFQPHLTPREVMKAGAFGGTYWRPIYSSVTGKNHRGHHRRYDFFDGIDEDVMTRPWDNYDKDINRYGVRVGQTLEQWEDNGWITKHDPYGHYQWYCEFYSGRRLPREDERQIKRWQGVRSRFGNRLQNMMNRRRKQAWEVSPKISQTLLHWYIDPEQL